VFQEWCRLALHDARPEEKEKIKKVVIPILLAESLQVHQIVSSAVFVVPEAFEQMDRLTFLVRGLTTTGFADAADAELRNALRSDARPLAESAILSQITPPGALIWLDFNSGEPPLPVIHAALHSITRMKDAYAERLVRICIERLGSPKWLAVSRFNLTNPDNVVAAGAAIALFDSGERNISILREPLAKALHDGGYIRRAEILLEELLNNSSTDNVKWLAEVIHAHSERDMLGGHSGEFRLLLNNIEKFSDGPSLFAWAIIGLGEFVLPRYPAVRQQIRDLLSGPQGTAYRNALRDKLSSTDSRWRRAAAATLVISFPDEESSALQAVVRATAAGIGNRWHEWEDYLLSINFGPIPLVALKSKLPSMPISAARFGYRLLLNNNINLTDSEQEQAIEAMLENYYRIREPELAFLKTPKAANFLLSKVKEFSGPLATQAASFLLQHHKAALSVEDLARCAALTITTTRWNRFVLADQLDMLRANADYSIAVENLGKVYTARTSQRLFLDLLRLSLTDPAKWDDIVWELMCKERTISAGLDEPGFWLLEMGQRDSIAGAAIGNAARKILAQQNQRQYWNGDLYQWLALLSDEFGGLPQAELESIISIRAIHREITAALLSRVKTVPAGFANQQSSTRRSGTVPANPEPVYTEASLKDAVREIDISRNTNLCTRLEVTLSQRVIRKAEIITITQTSNFGGVVGAVLAFTQNMRSRPEYVLSALPFMSKAYREQPPGCMTRLLTIANIQYEILRANPETRPQLIEALASELMTGNVLESTLLLLETRGYLIGAEAGKLIGYVVDHTYAVDTELLDAIVLWFEGAKVHAEHLTATIQAIQLGLTQIVEDTPDRFPALFGNAAVNMILALGCWHLTDTDNQNATIAFWRGLKGVLQIQSTQSIQPIAGLFRVVEPLLKVVDKDLLRSAVSAGQNDDDPIVRAASVVFCSFAGND